MNFDENGTYWPVDSEKLRHMPENENFICMFSGGKDCGLALSKAMKHGHLKGLLHCVDEDTKQSVWHLQSLPVIEEQARLIQTPLKIVTFSAWKRRTRLVNLYKELANQGIKTIVFGDLYEEKQAKLQVALCLSAGLNPCMPLWQLPYDYLITEIEEHKIESIITCIESNAIDSRWLGKVFNREAYLHFRELGIDPMGEQGEFHTTLVNADYFKQTLQYTLGKVSENKIRTIGFNLKMSALH